MARITWDNVGEKFYETGVKNCVLYPITEGAYPKGVAWNGITSITESPSGAEANPIYADDIKYLELYSVEEFGATIEAYTYPDEFAECDGSAEPEEGIIVGQQNRRGFGLCYRTTRGNDTDGDNYGYKLHLIWGAKCSPSEKAYQTINDSPEAITFSWEMTTTPVPVSKQGYKPTSCMTLDSAKLGAAKMKAIEDILYGAEGDARLPLPDEVLSTIAAVSA